VWERPRSKLVSEVKPVGNRSMERGNYSPCSEQAIDLAGAICPFYRITVCYDYSGTLRGALLGTDSLQLLMWRSILGPYAIDIQSIETRGC
jgi:hypothetical protein